MNKLYLEMIAQLITTFKNKKEKNKLTIHNLYLKFDE